MKEINSWNINDNILIKKINNYNVKITILKNDKNVFYRLEILEDKKIRLTFNFYSLEDCINFAENTISKCITTKGIIKAYEEQFEQNKFKSLVKSK